jgi:hypothetical protein
MCTARATHASTHRPRPRRTWTAQRNDEGSRSSGGQPSAKPTAVFRWAGGPARRRAPLLSFATTAAKEPNQRLCPWRENPHKVI